MLSLNIWLRLFWPHMTADATSKPWQGNRFMIMAGHMVTRSRIPAVLGNGTSPLPLGKCQGMIHAFSRMILTGII